MQSVFRHFLVIEFFNSHAWFRQQQLASALMDNANA
jgi:hypothetical protein